MDEAKGLSEENRALVERDGKDPKWVAHLFCSGYGPMLNRLLNAARAESRSTPDREGVARIIDPDEWDALDRGLITTKGRQLTATAALKARYCKRSLAKADAILALARRSITVAEPDAPGGFVGDIWFGHPVKRTLGTHRWTGAAWEELPDETVALMELLAAAREKIAALAAAPSPVVEGGGSTLTAARLLARVLKLADSGLFRDRAHLSVGAVPIMDDVREWLAAQGVTGGAEPCPACLGEAEGCGVCNERGE